MAIPFVAPIDLGKNEILNARVQNLSSAPAHGAGLIYFDTTTGLLGVSNGTAWTYLAVGGLDVEAVQDAVAAMVSSSTAVVPTYNDENGTLVFTIGAGQITNSMVSNTAAISADKLADGTTNKVYTATEKTKLAGVATGATANATDATLLNRANHTGTQTVATISDFTSAVNAVVANVVGAAPTSLDTLKELADALGNDANFASTVTTQLSLKANISSLATVATAGTYASLTGKPSYAANLGDGSATSYVVTHALGTRNIHPTLISNSAPYQIVMGDIRATSTTTATVVFGSAPTSNQYTLYITAA